MAEKLMLLVMVTCLIGLCASFEYSDLVAINATCAPKDTCIVDKGPRVGDSNDWKERNCFCDDLCGEYGDCCLDAHAYNVDQQKRPGHYECVHLKQFGDLYMRGTCMAGWEDLEIAMLCSSGTPDSSSDRRDPLVDLPVTSLDSAVTYTNFYCAVCNKDSSSLEMWKPRLECPTLASYHSRFRNLTMEYVSSNLIFNDENWGLYIDDNGVEVFHTCFIDPVLPETVLHLVRPCKKMTKTCASNWTDTDVENLCHSYTAVVYNFEHVYRNPHCAVCNYVPKNYTCFYRILTRFYFGDEFNPSAFSLLFDFVDTSGGNVVGSTSVCRPGEVFDPFFKKCRNVVCGKANQEYRFGRCIDIGVASDPAGDEVSTSSSTTTATTTSSTTTTTTSSPTTTSSATSPTTKPLNTSTEKAGLEDISLTTVEPSVMATTVSLNTTVVPIIKEVLTGSTNTSRERAQTLTCERFLLPADEFTMSANGTVVVEKYRRTYQPHEYEQTEGGILICIIQPETDKFSRMMGWVSLAGLGLSCVCLLLHLIAFLIVPDLRNLSGKNLASLCLVLLAAYTTFILSVFGEPGKRECFILAAAMYYFFLSSFCWMNVMAFDIWRTLKLATSELRVTVGGQWSKFILYCIHGWLLPAAALSVLVTLDLVRPDGLPQHYFPTLGERWCWFGQRKALLVFFAAPLVTIMLVNLVFFIFSAGIIAETTQSTAKMTSCSPHQSQFKLYMRLALLMGLTWISGIVAGYLQLEPIWYVFVLLNTLQGVFIFLAFTCTRKVWRVAAGGCWRRVVLARSCAPWVARSPSSSRQGLESRDSHDSQLSHASHTSATHLTSTASRTTVDAF
ncbi:adhesion G-protein coupled receptor G2 [Procambarus clarkii]|uniref:adhesion G-protein coupled receptor G2 n=1 Tax=Procambarus clarkii TaxID=6728 RepID=UPI0037439F89